MKANPRRRSAFAVASLGAALAAGCVAAPAPPAPRASPAAPPPLPPPARPAAGADWRDAPVTPGDWSWSDVGGASTASFGGGVLTLRCRPGDARVELIVVSPAPLAATMTVVTSSAARALPVAPAGGAGPGVVATVAPRDPLLDAIAFSRGRFAIAAPGAPMLVVPSWPEIGRVIEDCRAP